MAIEDIYNALDAFEDVDLTDVKKLVESEFASASESADAKVAELANQVEELTAALTETKARNYDLMVAATSKTEEDETEDNDEIDDANIDNLFKKED